MNKYIKQITFLTVITAMIALGTAISADAQARPYRVSDRQVQTLLTRIENRTDTFKNQVDRALDNSNIDGTRQEDSLNSIISNFENSTNRLKDNFSANRSSATDVQDVLQRAVFINSFVRNNRLSTAAQRTWTSIRTDLNTLAGYYRVSANWNAPVITPQNAYIGSDTQVRNLIAQIESRTNNFKRQISRNLNDSNIDGTNREDSINSMVANFESATNRLKNNFSSRRSTANDVQEVIDRGVSINTFVANNRLSNPAENSWRQIRTNLNTLAGYYRVSANWNAPVANPQTVYIGTDTQVRNLIAQIESRTNTFKNQIGRILNNSNIDGTNREDSINSMVSNFESATNRLKNNFSSRRSTANDVEEVLNRAVAINSFVANNRLSNPATTSWNQIRTNLNTLAGYYRVGANWNTTVLNPQNVYIGTDTQVRNLINQIESRTNTFKNQIGRNLNNSNVDGTNREDSINTMVSNFESATNRLKNNFSSRRSTTNDVQDLLNRAVSVNTFVANNRLSNAAESSWDQIRSDLNTLAGYYRVSSNWNNTVITPGGGQWGGGYGNFDSRLTGIYRLNVSQSDNVSTMIDRSINNARYQANARDRMRTNLERRLQSPEVLTFEKRGQTITMSSSNAQTVTLNADGVQRSETSPNGRTVTTSVVANNNEVTITYDGDRMNDFFVTFAPQNNGQLRVTRRVFIENTNETVTVSSVYDKTSQVAEWNNNGGQPNYTGGATGGFVIPNNTAMIATLDAPLSTRTARAGERFTMTVNSPSQFDGAVIEGNVTGKQSGVVAGRASMSLSFTSIRMRDGRTYQFAGIIDEVREVNGTVINVDNEGAVRDRSQTTTTATRAGIGAVLGAIIGAIAGGGSGAAIGAGVGAGAGAGTVILQGRDNLELERGTQFSLTATSPSNVAIR